MKILLVALLLLFPNAVEACSFTPVYYHPEDHDAEWLYIWQHRPIQPKQEIPKYFRLPPTLAPGDSFASITTKVVTYETDLVTNAIKDQAKDMAKAKAKEVAPQVASKIEHITVPKIELTTYSIKHNLKYDTSSGIVLYTADATSMFFTAKHETLTNAETLSLAYRMNPFENVGFRYKTPDQSITFFIEGAW